MIYRTESVRHSGAFPLASRCTAVHNLEGVALRCSLAAGHAGNHTVTFDLNEMGFVPAPGVEGSKYAKAAEQ